MPLLLSAFSTGCEDGGCDFPTCLSVKPVAHLNQAGFHPLLTFYFKKHFFHPNFTRLHRASTHFAKHYLVYGSTILPSRGKERIQNPRKQLVSRPCHVNCQQSSLNCFSRSILFHSTRRLPLCQICGQPWGCCEFLFHLHWVKVG